MNKYEGKKYIYQNGNVSREGVIEKVVGLQEKFHKNIYGYTEDYYFYGENNLFVWLSAAESNLTEIK